MDSRVKRLKSTGGKELLFERPNPGKRRGIKKKKKKDWRVSARIAVRAEPRKQLKERRSSRTGSGGKSRGKISRTACAEFKKTSGHHGKK